MKVRILKVISLVLEPAAATCLNVMAVLLGLYLIKAISGDTDNMAALRVWVCVDFTAVLYVTYIIQRHLWSIRHTKKDKGEEEGE